VDEERRRTLQTLVELAEGWDAVGCWDPERATELLRKQSSPDELREIGVSEEVIRRIWSRAEASEKR